MGPLQTFLCVCFTFLSISVTWTTAPMSDYQCLQQCNKCWDTNKCRGFPKWQGNEPPCRADWSGSKCRCHVKCPYQGRQCIPLNACKPGIQGKSIPSLQPPPPTTSRTTKAPSTLDKAANSETPAGRFQGGRGIQLSEVTTDSP